jgi:very-short-patch-repair endonuclease
VPVCSSGGRRLTKCASCTHFVLAGGARRFEQDEMRPDRRIVTLAGQRHGIVTARELGDAGLSPKAISHRVACGWLVRRHRGVYLVGPLEAPLSRAMGAVLAVGDGAVLSHRSAAVVWELLRPCEDAIHVTVRDRAPRHRAGIRVHEARTLAGEDTTQHRKLPITTPARTLLDLAATLTPREIDRAVEQAELRRLTTTDQLTHVVARSRSHRGVAALRAALHPARQLTRSEAERRLLALIEAARLPTPAANTRVAGHEVDFLWPGQRLIVEVDGYAFHASRAAFERDRVRDADLQARAYRVIRVTWRRLTTEPEAVIAAIAAALAIG